MMNRYNLDPLELLVGIRRHNDVKAAVVNRVFRFRFLPKPKPTANGPFWVVRDGAVRRARCNREIAYPNRLAGQFSRETVRNEARCQLVGILHVWPTDGVGQAVPRVYAAAADGRVGSSCTGR